MERSNAQATLTESCADMAASSSDQGDDHSALCLAHCQADSKSADHVSPQLPVFLPVLMSVIEPTRLVIADFRGARHAEVAARAPPPPLTVLHCSFQT
ncbi:MULTISPECIES: hypothetical protein [Cupriavidus]